MGFLCQQRNNANDRGFIVGKRSSLPILKLKINQPSLEDVKAELIAAQLSAWGSEGNEFARTLSPVQITQSYLSRLSRDATPVSSVV